MVSVSVFSMRDLYEFASLALSKRSTPGENTLALEAGLIVSDICIDGPYWSCTQRYLDWMSIFEPYDQRFLIGGVLPHTPIIDNDYSRFIWSRGEGGDIHLKFAYGLEVVKL